MKFDQVKEYFKAYKPQKRWIQSMKRNQKIMEKRMKGISLRDIATEFKLSRERVRAIEEDTLKKVKKYFSK